MKSSGGSEISGIPDGQLADDAVEPGLTPVSDALEHLSAATLILDGNQKILYINPAAAELTGHELAVGQSIQQIMGRVEGEERFVLLPDTKVDGSGRVIGEFRFTRRDGAVSFIAYTAKPLEIGDSASGILVELRDLSGERQAQEQLRRSEERFRGRLAAIVESTDDAIVSKDLDGYITSWNRSAERLFGYTAQEALGEHITLIIPEDRLAEEDDIIARLRQGQRITHFETIRRHKDGGLIPISLTISPIVDADGGVVGASKIARDITKQKLAQAELETQSRTLAALLRVASSRSADLDVDRLAQVVTEAGTEMSGAQFGAFFYNVLDENGQRITMHAAAGMPPQALSGLTEAAEGATYDPSAHVQGTVRCDDIANDERCRTESPYGGLVSGTTEVRSFLAVPVALRAGEVIGVLFFGHAEAGVFDDRAEMMITALAGHAATALDNARLYEQALSLNATLEEKVKQRTAELSALNQELESFNYSVSHDLRAPLRGIDGFSQVLLEDYSESLDDTAKHYLSRIKLGTQRMSNLIDDLLDLSYLSRTSLHIEEIDMVALVNHLVEELQEREPDRNVKVLVPEMLIAHGDVSLVQILLENLLGNAWKFTSSRDEGIIRLGADEIDGETVYFVQDNGAGFSMKYEHKLFAPFQRLHGPNQYEGTGIGLATVHRIVRRHGGTIWARSAEGEGATFYFTLPWPGQQKQRVQ